MNEETELGLITAEKIVLGSIILSNPVLDDVIEMLSADDFYLHSHRLVYDAMLDLYDRREPIEYGSIYSVLKARDQFSKTPGAAWLATLADDVGSLSSAVYYARQVRKGAIIRGLARAATSILDKCFDEPESETLIEECQKLFWNACDAHTPSGLVPLGEAAMNYLACLQEIEDRGERVSGLLTGFRDLDTRLLGLQKTDLVVLAARPSVGKTSLSFHAAVNAARHGSRVAYFSIEMDKSRIGEKGISLSMPIDTSALRSGGLSDDTWRRLALATKDLDHLPFRVCDDARISPIEIKAKSQRMKRDMGLDLIVVDYLQLMQRPRTLSKFEGVGENVQEMKAIAKELGVPILLLSQLNREIESRGAGAEPQMSDLGESGEIERTADVIVFLYNDADPLPNTVNVKIGKNRTGATGLFKLHYEKRFNRFGNHSEN